MGGRLFNPRYLTAHLPTNQPAYLPTYLPTEQPSNRPTHTHPTTIHIIWLNNLLPRLPTHSTTLIWLDLPTQFGRHGHQPAPPAAANGSLQRLSSLGAMASWSPGGCYDSLLTCFGGGRVEVNLDAPKPDPKVLIWFC